MESAHLSSGIKEKIFSFLSLFFPDIQTGNIDGIDYFIRKNAHFFAYLFLGILTCLAVTKSLWQRPFFVAMIVCVLYAISDECHQLFVPGRSGQLSDVILDSSGALLGIVLIIFLLRIFPQKK
jgi:VanZ family protein